MERDPDIAALAARLGLRRLAYRSFARPVPAPSVVVAKPDPPAMPAQEAAPPPAVAAAPPPVIADGVTAVSVPMPAAGAVSLRVVQEPAPHFPLLAQALARDGASAAVGPASAQPFLNLRRAVASPSDAAGH